MKHALYDLTAVGLPFTDFFLEPADDLLLLKLGVAKGTTAEVDSERMSRFLSELPSVDGRPGGSPSNTCAVVRALGGSAAFLGKRCDDRPGRLFREEFSRIGVHYPTSPYEGSEPGVSGTCLIQAEADGPETMAYCAGVGTVLHDKDMPEDVLAASNVVYIQAYLLFHGASRPAVLKALLKARAAKRRIAFSLHGPEMTTAEALAFLRLHLEAGDVVLGNRREYETVFDTRDLKTMAKTALIVITDGALGAYVLEQDTMLHVPALMVQNIENTIGAGDAFAGGFLHGLAKGRSPERAGALGARAAAEILQSKSGRPDGDWSALRAEP